mgnify:CR=1 FL=1|jgi:phage gp36-like protein
MTYAVQADLETRFGAAEVLQLADRDGDEVADVGVVSGALAEAAAEIDAHLAGRYALPLATVPPILVRLACDIARYRLAADNPMEEVRKRYEDARRLLESLAAGRVSLGLPTAEQPPTGGVAVSAPVAVFSDSEGF